MTGNPPIQIRWLPHWSLDYIERHEKGQHRCLRRKCEALVDWGVRKTGGVYGSRGRRFFWCDAHLPQPYDEAHIVEIMRANWAPRETYERELV